MWFQVPEEGTNTQADIATLKLNCSRGQFGENMPIRLTVQEHCQLTKYSGRGGPIYLSTQFNYNDEPKAAPGQTGSANETGLISLLIKKCNSTSTVNSNKCYQYIGLGPH